MLEEAKEIHVTSAAGLDYVMRKDGRKGAYQCGIADEPGRWDHWPSGLVTCAPLEDSAEGRYAASRATCCSGSGAMPGRAVEMTIKKGRIVKIEGGTDAYLLQSYLDSNGDEGAYRFSHAGWGTDDRADWGAISDGLGSPKIARCSSPSAEHVRCPGRALRPRRPEKSLHRSIVDICSSQHLVRLDGKLIENEQFIVPDLR